MWAPSFSLVADNTVNSSDVSQAWVGTVELRFSFGCQVLRGGCSDTSFRVAMQGWRMVFADRTKMGHTSKVGSLINLSRIDLHYALESH